MSTKYVRTKRDEIIIFSELQNHSDFKYLDPISAGFIQFYVENGKMKLQIYGRSQSLNLDHNKDDIRLIYRQILNYEHYQIDEILKE